MSEDDQGQGSRSLRKPSVFFWVAAAGFAVALPLSLIDGDFLHAGILSAIVLCLGLQQTGLAERSAAWKWLYNASAVIAGLSALLLFLTNVGVL